MSESLKIAGSVGEMGEIPVGAVVVDRLDNILAIKGNSKESRQDPTAHAEIIAIQEACRKLRSWRLNGCTIYVTLEPCLMCAGAIIQSRIGQLVYGVDDPKTGSIRTMVNSSDGPSSNHRLKVVTGIMELECREQLKSWFEKNLR